MIYVTKEYFFIYLPMAKGEKNVIEKIISSIYKDNMQIKKEKNLFAFHKFDLPLLWSLSKIGYYRQLVFACFVDNFVYKCFVLDISCCDNCFYSLYKSANAEEDSGIFK